MTTNAKVRTCLWFNDNALPAAEFYCSLLPDSRIEKIGRQPNEAGADGPDRVVSVEFTLAGTPYMGLNGGPRYELDEAVSISVSTEDQAETDRLWDALVADGGSELWCGWLKDRFGLSWQIVPKRLLELLDGEYHGPVWDALMQMCKIDIDKLEAAAKCS